MGLEDHEKHFPIFHLLVFEKGELFNLPPPRTSRVIDPLCLRLLIAINVPNFYKPPECKCIKRRLMRYIKKSISGKLSLDLPSKKHLPIMICMIMIDTKSEIDFALLSVRWNDGQICDVLILRPHLHLASFGVQNTHRTLYKIHIHVFVH